MMTMAWKMTKEWKMTPFELIALTMILKMARKNAQ